MVLHVTSENSESNGNDHYAMSLVFLRDTLVRPQLEYALAILDPQNQNQGGPEIESPTASR